MDREFREHVGKKGESRLPAHRAGVRGGWQTPSQWLAALADERTHCSRGAACRRALVSAQGSRLVAGRADGHACRIRQGLPEERATGAQSTDGIFSDHAGCCDDLGLRDVVGSHAMDDSQTIGALRSSIKTYGSYGLCDSPSGFRGWWAAEDVHSSFPVYPRRAIVREPLCWIEGGGRLRLKTRPKTAIIP